MKHAEAGSQHGLVPDSIGETGTRIPVVVGLLDAAGIPVHPGKGKTANQVIPGDAERRRAGCVEIDVMIVLLNTAEFEVVPNAESQRKFPCGSPFVLNISRIIRMTVDVLRIDVIGHRRDSKQQVGDAGAGVTAYGLGIGAAGVRAVRIYAKSGWVGPVECVEPVIETGLDGVSALQNGEGRVVFIGARYDYVEDGADGA